MRTDTAPILELRSVAKRFGGLTALKDVSLTVGRGEICGVIGPNGAGKSTLFSVIAGSVLPSAGSVIFSGRDVTGLSMYRRTRMGLARTFQLAHTFESMTVEDNILVGAENHSRLNLFGALRTSMATCGYETVREFHKAEVMVAPALQTEGKQLQRSQSVGMGS